MKIEAARPWLAVAASAHGRGEVPASPMGADRVELGGAAAVSQTEADAALARVLQQAAERGVSFIEQSSLSSVEVSVSRALAVLSGAESGRGGIVWTDGRRSQRLSNEQDALAYAFLTAGAAPDGLARPELAAAVKAAEVDGLRFYTLQGRATELSTFAAWSALVHPTSQAALVGLGMAGVGLAPCEGGDVVSARRAVAPWLSAWREVLAPSGRPEREQRAVLARLAAVPAERVAETARLFLDVCEAVEKTDRVSPYQVRDEVEKTNRWIDERLPRLHAPSAQLTRLISWIGACGPQGAREAGDVAFDRLRLEHAEEADYQRALSLFDTLLRGTGDVGAAEEAARAVSTTVGTATEGERLAAFQRLLALHPTESSQPSGRTKALRARAAEAAADYAVVRDALPPDGEALAARVGQFALLADALANVHQGDEARSIFAFIENGLRDGAFGAADRQAVTLRFLEALVKSGDVAVARAETLRGATDDVGTGGVTRDGDNVVIGGIRVPVRPSPS